MKLVSFRGPGGEIRTGAVVRDRIVELSEAIGSLVMPEDRAAEHAARGVVPTHSGILRVLQAGPQALAAIEREADKRAGEDGFDRLPLIGDTVLLAPLPRPGKIVAVGRNYADHAKETGVDPFENPRIIAKLPSSTIGHASVVKCPAPVRKFDFEGELGVVIGEYASNVARERALDFVAGYTVLNDLSAREFQFDISPAQTTFAKSMDGFCPMGPWMVTKDEVADPQQLELSTFVNEVRVQHAHTSDMIFPVARLIEYLSQFMTLEPGDVLATGTPAGVGAFRNPAVWLQPGDRIRIELSQVGVLETEIG